MSGFVTGNKPCWDELERLLAQARKSMRSMTPSELARLDQLYRRTTIHLAQATTRGGDPRLASYLNDLTVAAHSVIYVPPRKRLLAGIGYLYREGIARQIVRQWKFHALSAGLLLGGFLLAYFASLADPLAAYAIWPADESRQLGSTREQLLDVLRHGRDQASGEKFSFGSFLFAHNLRCGFLAMAAGVLLGLPTVVLMLYNGMILGVFVAIHHRAGIDSEMWAWILPHGVTEFAAIILCGGAGLALGAAALAPGKQTRTEALREAGRSAAVTVMGAGSMLVLAAILESYLRQSHLSTQARLAFAAGSAIFWALVLLYGFVFERRSEQVAPT